MNSFAEALQPSFAQFLFSISSIAHIALGCAAAYFYFRYLEVSEKTRDKSLLNSFTTSTFEDVLPDWTKSLSEYFSRTYKTDEEMMDLAIYLSSRNATEGTGGPFGCAIFQRDHHTNLCRLTSIGVNRVVSMNNSTLHAETVAIQIAQRKLQTYSLRKTQPPKKNGIVVEENCFELFTSCEPCAMCLGAILWSGVTRVVCGASKDDASSIGFDEGPVFEESYNHLENAGVRVKRSVLKEKAAQVLYDYGKNGIIYNA